MASKLLPVKSKIIRIFQPLINSYVYYMYNERPYTFLCLCEAGFSKFKCLTFLKDIRDQFVRSFTDDERGGAIAHGLSRSFETILKDRMVILSAF